MNTIKKTPQRTCIACRKISGKRGLVRIVRTPEGKVVSDPSCRMAGRGAYVCCELPCLNTALKGRQIEHVLKTEMTAEDLESLRSAVGEIIKERSIV